MKNSDEAKRERQKAARDAILNAPDLPLNGSTPVPQRKHKAKSAVSPELSDALNGWGVFTEPEHLHDPTTPFDSADPSVALASINPVYLVDSQYSREEPWGMMDGESERDYQLFSHYRALGLARTKTDVARHFSVHNNSIYKLAGENDWDNRVRAWDRHKEEQYTAELLEQTRAMAGIHAKVAATGIKALASVFDVLIERTADIDDLREQFADYPTATLLRLAQDTAKALPNLMSAERLSRGLPTELTATVIKQDTRITVRTSDEFAEILSTLAFAQPTVIDGRDLTEDLDDDGGGESAA